MSDFDKFIEIRQTQQQLDNLIQESKNPAFDRISSAKMISLEDIKTEIADDIKDEIVTETNYDEFMQDDIILNEKTEIARQGTITYLGGGIGRKEADDAIKSQAQYADFSPNGSELTATNIHTAIIDTYNYSKAFGGAALSGIYVRSFNSTSGNIYLSAGDNVNISQSLTTFYISASDTFKTNSANYYTKTEIVDGTPDFNLLDFNISADKPSYQEGRLFWDDPNNTLSLYTDINGVQLQIGQENYIRAVNKTTATIPNGTLVEIVGATGNRPKISACMALPNHECSLIGMATHDILVDMEGFVTTTGVVGDLNTSDYNEGDQLYLSPSSPGQFTKIKPNVPYPITKIGRVLVSHVNAGKILIDIEKSTKLEDLNNVDGTPAVEGSLLVYNGTSAFWDVRDNINNLVHLSSAPTFSAITIGTNGNTITIDSSGNVSASGNATGWDDIFFPFFGDRLDVAAGNLEYDYDNGGVIFSKSSTSANNNCIHITAQLNHKYKEGSDIYPHIHYIQTQSASPYWYMIYRWYNNGDQVPVFVGINNTSGHIPYVSGTMLQMATFPKIIGTGKKISSFLDIKIARIGANDTIAGDVLGKQFDVHYEIDNPLGSRTVAEK